MVAQATNSKIKEVSEPIAEYNSVKDLWDRNRAVCGGESYVKAYDTYIDKINYRNLLLLFSPTMSQQQYDFYKAEAELPGIVSQFSKMLIGGLLRKEPEINLPKDVPEDTLEWILNDFGRDNSSLITFLDSILWEEIQTSRAWVYVDYPMVDNMKDLTKEEIREITPYPIIWQAESVINWKTKVDQFGKQVLSLVIVRSYEESVEGSTNEFHTDMRDTIRVHDLDESGKYRIRIYQTEAEESSIPVVQGSQFLSPLNKKPKFALVETIQNILIANERLDFIPAWPLNGEKEVRSPLLTPLIDKEVALYNKISRRNHLLYGASTYTPVISSDMSDEEFKEIVESGLGSWLHLGENDKASILETPTAALQDMDRAIASGIEEMAKLGIRMLTPETAQSGVALEIRNASQTAQLGTLNTKISSVMTSVITFMINWRYGTEYSDNDVDFKLSSDFNPIPIGADWLRLATEWYQNGLIPRSVWLKILKQNDMVEADYDDEEGQKEITADDMIVSPDDTDNFADKIRE